MTKNDLKIQILTRGGWDTTYTVPEATLDTYVDRSHRFASGYYKWPFTEGRVSTTFASLVTNEDGYLRGEYPEGWKSDSIRLLHIGGKQVDKKEFYQFTKFLEDNSSATDRIFSDFARQYYINPNIDLSGTVTVWGQYVPAPLADEDTVFTGEDEGNEAIVEMGMSYVYKRLGKSQEARLHEQTSRGILEEVWKRIQAEQFAYQVPDNEGMFKRIDVIDGGLTDDIFKRDQF